jgi:glutathione peroxidase
LGSERIKWNFTKFLIDRTGRVAQRFAPMTKPEEIKPHIERLL